SLPPGLPSPSLLPLVRNTSRGPSSNYCRSCFGTRLLLPRGQPPAVTLALALPRCSPQHAAPIPVRGYKQALSSRTELLITFSAELVGIGVEALLDRIAQLWSGGMAPLGDLVVLNLLEDRLDLVEFRAVGWQVVQVNPLTRQFLALRLERLAD